MAEIIGTGLRIELDRQHARAQPEIDYAARRVTELEAERRRLARGVVNGSIPDDLAAEEQDRITTELRQAKAVASVAEDINARIEDTLTTALSYVTRVEDAYRLGMPNVRRLANQCFFEKLLIRRTDDDVTVSGAIYREPWATLLAESFQQRMAQNTETPASFLLTEVRI